jgi:hypothetical protein
MQPEQSEPAPETGFSPRGCRFLAGLDVGFAGGLAVLLWLVIHSRLAGEWWWSKLNVAGGLFYGADVYSMGPGRATLAGGALLILVYAIAGQVFAQIAPVSGHARNALLALFFASFFNFAANRWVLPRLDPFAPAFFPFQVMLAGNLLFALALTRFPGRFRSLALTFGDPSWTSILRPENRPQTPVSTDSMPDIVESEADRIE